MLTKYTYLKVILIAATCLFTAGLYAAEEGLEEDVKAEEEEGKAAEEGIKKEEGTAATEEMPAEEGMDEEGMLEEVGEELPPLYTNAIELGVIYSSEDSFKFGEYNGLEDSGFHALGNLSVLGNDGTMRWSLFGTDLGLTSRYVNGSLSTPGLWDLNVRYDALQHNISDTYQTPLQGSLGGNNFTLPVDFGTINANNAFPSARVLTPTQLSAFHIEEIHSDRDNISVGGGYHFNEHWSMRFDFNHLDQSGAKLLGTGSQGGIALTGGSTGRAEANNIIMNPTEYTTNTFNLALNWQGDKGYLSVGWFGSFFNDEYNSLSWQNALASGASACIGPQCYVNNTMSTAPDNTFNQVNLNGGYLFSAMTKLVGGFSYGFNIQDENFAPTLIPQASGTPYDMMQAGGLPRSSLDGEVHTIHGDLKLTHKLNKDLMLSGAFKYNERDNRTDSNTYLYHNLGNGNYTGVNLPYSNRKIQAEAAADYRVTQGQKLHLGYEHEYFERWCDDVAAVLGVVYECVASPSSNEDKLELIYRVKASETVQLNVGYTFADRYADFDHNFAANTGSYPVLNAEDKLGYNAYIYDSRIKHMGEGGINWQATDKLDFGLIGRYSDLDYDATLGVQDGQESSVNLDATYIYNENGSVSAYASWQNSERELRNGLNGSATVAPTNIWTNQLNQDSYAIGLNVRQGGLMGGKLEVLGDVSYSFDTSHYSTQVPYDPTCTAANKLTCGDTPDIETSLFALNLNGAYQVNKNGKVALGYLYQLFDSNDYYYNGYQYGFTPNRVMPTNEQAPSYSEHVIFFSYIYEF